MKSFLQFHRQGAEPLREEEIAILNGVLSLNERRVSDIMTPLSDVVMLSADEVLDKNAVDRLYVPAAYRGIH